ncbi:hypothetical protein C0995_013364 [Termitomyces sp. Mi166|nr:hypothetical protein C0995_013364 [Termitomyces sp. Mi166\
MSNSSTNTLDHIVHLTPPGSVEETSQQFWELGFTVIPGGTHADGLTANALVVLADGVYLELISFTHPVSYYPSGSPGRVARESHRWASKSSGWIDFAFLGNGLQTGTNCISNIINDRGKQEGSNVDYNPEVPGGRKRPDGKVLNWVISSPGSGVRGALPFFCGDVTPREWRVPSDPPPNIEHLSTAKGISHILVLTSPETFPSLTQQLTTVIGTPAISSTSREAIWQLEAVHKKRGGPKLILRTARTEGETSFVQEVGTGIFEVAFSTEGKEGNTTSPYGRIAWTIKSARVRSLLNPITCAAKMAPKGGNAKKESGRAKKAENEANKKAQEAADKERKEAEKWKDGAKTAKASKQEKEDKRQADLARKAENARLLAEEEAAAPSKVKSAPKAGKSKPTPKPAGPGAIAAGGGLGAVSSAKDDVPEEKKEIESYAATGIDNALDLLEVVNAKMDKASIGQQAAGIERHPEAAFEAYQERELPKIKIEHPGLRLQQYKDLLYKQFQKSPENPFNQTSVAYDATKEQKVKALEDKKAQVEERLKEK